jgi:hypothetical protein
MKISPEIYRLGLAPEFIRVTIMICVEELLLALDSEPVVSLSPIGIECFSINLVMTCMSRKASTTTSLEFNDDVYLKKLQGGYHKI